MVVSIKDVRKLEHGAKEAHLAGIHRLGGLLDGITRVAQMLHDGSDLDVEIELPELVARAVRIAEDLTRDANRGCAADAQDEPAA